MASPQLAAESAGTSPSKVEQITDGVSGLKLDEQNTATAQSQQDSQVEKPQEVESQLTRLHRLCAEGDVMGVRAILSQGLDLLESIGKYPSRLVDASPIAGQSLRNGYAQTLDESNPMSSPHGTNFEQEAWGKMEANVF